MSTVGQKERATQARIIQLFRDRLGYTYLGNWEKGERKTGIERDALRKWWREEKAYPEDWIKKALHELERTAGNQTQSLYDLNKAVYSLLRYGIKISPGAGEQKETVELIDWKNIDRNHFGVAEEVTIKGEHTKRPDVVLYVNGIALGVLELKRSTVSISEGIRQNLDNQKALFIRPFFATMQLVMAGNDTQGLRYGTIETEEKYYLQWKEESAEPNRLDRDLLQLCNKVRLLEIIHDFTAFDRGDKKLCRHNQYFGIRATQEAIRRREGGIIWHTQGSGKSLTMVWTAKWILENITGARILIITDRDELDKQIEGVFSGVDEKIYRTRSGADLIEKLNADGPPLLCSLIHKFRGVNGREEEDGDATEFIDELKRALPTGFRAKGDLYVFVDECHRTQSGQMHAAMKTMVPGALFIGFTGTPLLKKDKQKSIEIFGRYIHTYKFDEAVADGVVLDLLYEARDVEQHIKSPGKIDQWFETKTKGLNDYQKLELKKRWGTLQKVLSSRDRLEKIVEDIILDMNTRPRLMSGAGNAILVSGSIYQACRYYQLFQQTELKGKCAIVTSYNPSAASIKGESVSTNAETERLMQYEVYKEMLGGEDPEKFEDTAKEKFIKQPAQMKLLIVVDKLLTGFDAPSATYLYIDKKMQDHGLFQAICRVNRLDGDSKEYGYVVDYKDLFKKLQKSIDDYTSEAFDDFDADDVDGLLADRLTRTRERLEEAVEALRALCEDVAPPRDQHAYQRYFCGNPERADDLKDTEERRKILYTLTVALIRAWAALANELEEAGYTPAQAQKLGEEVAFYTKLRDEIKLASGEHIDLKAYEPDMRYLIDAYIKAEDSRVVSTLGDRSLLEVLATEGIEALTAKMRGAGKAAMAEAIENNVRKLITEERATNPVYFDKMSVLLEEIIRLRAADALAYEEYLQKMAELCGQVVSPHKSAAYPSTMNSPARRALFDNVGQDEALAIVLDEAVRYVRKDDWRAHPQKRKEVRNALRKHLPAEEDLERIFEIVQKQTEY